MATVSYTQLDMSNPQDVTAYERALYRAFAGAAPMVNERIRTFDHAARRAAPRIPYDSQAVLVGSVGRRIVAGVSLNGPGPDMPQLEMFGFTVDSPREEITEAIGLFNLLGAGFAGELTSGLAAHAFEYAREHGMHRLYGTCVTRRLHAYLHMGWEKVDQRPLGDDHMHLLVLPVD